MNSKAKYYPTAFVLYLNYFVQGIATGVLGQQIMKEALVTQWGGDIVKDIGLVATVVAAAGLGRLIILPFAGPLSDKLGRKICVALGALLYAVSMFMIAKSPTMMVAYIGSLISGSANSFLDCGVIPCCVEILAPRTGLATILTKFFISGGQKVLPMILGFAATASFGMTNVIFYTGVAFLVVAIFIFIAPVPKAEKTGEKQQSLIQQLKGTKFTIESWGLIAIGFTCTATFQLWLYCAQTYGARVCGMTDTTTMQSYYASGTILAIIVTAIITMKIKPVRILFIYPLISCITVFAVYFAKTPEMCNIGAGLMGFFVAGGVLQMATATVNDLFPKIKGTITAIIMIASSISMYTVMTAAGKMSPESVLLMNGIIAGIGTLIALFVNIRYKNLLANVEE